MECMIWKTIYRVRVDKMETQTKRCKIEFRRDCNGRMKKFGFLKGRVWFSEQHTNFPDYISSAGNPYRTPLDSIGARKNNNMTVVPDRWAPSGISDVHTGT